MTRVSFIVACYNSQDSILELVQSLEKVAGAHDEIIICDDGSEDDTVLRIENYHSSVSLQLIKNVVNSGRAFSRNRAINLSSGKYLAVYDSDDIALPSALDPLDLLENDASIAMASTQILLHSKYFGYWIMNNYPLSNHEIQLGYERGESPMSHGGSILRREVACDVGLYNPTYSRSQDFDLLRRIAKIGSARNVTTYGYLYMHNIWLRFTYWSETKRNRNIILGYHEGRKVNHLRWFAMNITRSWAAISSFRKANSIAKSLGLK